MGAGGIFAAIILTLLIAGSLAAILAMHAFRQQRDHLARGENPNGQGDTMSALSPGQIAPFHSATVTQARQRNHV